ncbi:MAG: CRISPR-associated endonuclease Cas3'', partial [Deltaproteobacteria bacterium HGW-Deltaproteobacteria-21]
MENYLRYWGKTGEGGSYHLLPYHCLDVAAVGSLLLAPANDLCRRLASNLEIDPAVLQRWFSFCLSLHDLGKFATAFQGQVPNLSRLLVLPNPRMPYTERHDTLGFLLWCDFLTSKWFKRGGFGFYPEHTRLRAYLHAMDPWLEIVTGHHGVPPKLSSIRRQEFFTEPDEQAAFQYCMTVSDLFLDNLDLSFLADKSLKKRLRQQSWLLAGVVVLADWLGSSLNPSDYCKTPKKL